jgi:hypothetical protein
MSALLAGLACGKNLDTMAKPDESAVKTDSTQDTVGYKPMGRDTTDMATDSARANQTKSGVIDSSGQSVTGDTVTQTRPDQGQPVTVKGDTINTGVDSTNQAPSGNVGVDTAAHPSADTSGMQSVDTTAHMGHDTTTGTTDSTAH